MSEGVTPVEVVRLARTVREREDVALACELAVNEVDDVCDDDGRADRDIDCDKLPVVETLVVRDSDELPLSLREIDGDEELLLERVDVDV